MIYKKILTSILLFFTYAIVSAQSMEQEAFKLIERLLPKHSKSFKIEPLTNISNGDAFEVESRNGQIILRGNSGVSVASALYYYLTEYAHCQVTWNGTNLNLPKILPPVPAKIVRNSPYEYRYYLNYCTFSYSMSWWDWSRWEKEIDWMALHGINMPLAITGEEYTWYLVYKELGFSDEDLKDFFTGPAYFGWFWMGNMDAYGGPLPLSWMKNQMALQQKIVKRQRALGMKPILPAFTGHVPASFKNMFPMAKLKATNWHNGFSDTYILDAEDPMFAKLGKIFLEKQTELMGTDHYYSADTFNENEPPSDDPAYLSKLSAKVYDGMQQADPKAIWVMQGWLFFSDRKFWKEPQVEALLSAVPDDKMIILDLATEIEPIWKRTKAFYGKPWIWNMLNNFGANTNMFGRMEAAAIEPAKAKADPASGKMKGIGLTMEGIEQNPVLYELLTANIWRSNPIDLDQWLPQYVRNRYGAVNVDALKAWDILRNTVYSVPEDRYIRDGAESIIQGRPTLNSRARWVNTKLNYDPKDLLPAWEALLKASSKVSNSDGYRYDLVDLTRQVLANYALDVQAQISNAYNQKNINEYNKYSQSFIDLIDDMDALLATRSDFLLGNWVQSARDRGDTEDEKALYETNAKNLITLWGDKESPLHEYACKQWSGLLTDFYKPRWQQFFSKLSLNLESKEKFDQKAFENQIKEWEWNWVHERKDYPTSTIGDSVKKAKELFAKYYKTISSAYNNSSL